MSDPIVVAALYQFKPLPDFEAIKPKLLKTCVKNGIKGTILLAHEGLNGTIAGSRAGIDAIKTFIEKDLAFDALEYKESFADDFPFYRMKVKLKKEIVTIGRDDVSPIETVGTYLEPEAWNTVITRDDVLVIDTRNDYEVAIGSFKNALDPKTKNFREFPEFVEKHFDPQKHKNVAMFCTGGIRCEKASSLMKKMGFENVYHLKGGILKYLETMPADQSLWQGECFVFDQRVSVKHGLELGSYDQCHACRMPITEDDKKSPHYQKGVSCHHCYHQHDDAKRAAFAEREKQIALADARGDQHIGKKHARHLIPLLEE
jgi:UPF0176 protein